MSTTLTPTLGLIKPAYNTEKNAWGDHVNNSFNLIDDFASKAVRQIGTGGGSNGALAIALPNASADLITRCRLIMGAVRAPDGSNIFARLSNDNAATFKSGASDYDYVRADVSAKSGGTQTFAGSTGASGILLTPTLNLPATDGNYLAIDIDIFNNASTFFTRLTWVGNVVDNDGSGYRTDVRGSGAFLVTSAAPTHLRVSGSLAGDFNQAITSRWVLLTVPKN